jgi:hypothetical protein
MCLSSSPARHLRRGVLGTLSRARQVLSQPSHLWLLYFELLPERRRRSELLLHTRACDQRHRFLLAARHGRDLLVPGTVLERGLPLRRLRLRLPVTAEPDSDVPSTVLRVLASLPNMPPFLADLRLPHAPEPSGRRPQPVRSRLHTDASAMSLICRSPYDSAHVVVLTMVDVTGLFGQVPIGSKAGSKGKSAP